MHDDHVPSIGLRTWTVFVAASIFGGNIGDIVTRHLGSGLVDHMLAAAAILAAIFICERNDWSKTHAWYWMAVVTLQSAATMLVDFSTIKLGFGRAAVLASLSVILLMAFELSRSSSTLIVLTHLMTRPGAAAKPVTDLGYWMTMMMVSMMGVVSADSLTFGLRVGALGSSLILLALLGGIFWLRRQPKANRLLVYWMKVVIIRAAGTAIGDFLAGHRYLDLGLPTSATLTGAATVRPAALVAATATLLGFGQHVDRLTTAQLRTEVAAE